MKILKYAVFTGIGAAVIFIVYKYYQCKTKGDASGKIYECGLFKGKPTYIEPGETDYRKSQGKCYEVTEYGKRMSYKEVELELCN